MFDILKEKNLNDPNFFFNSIVIFLKLIDYLLIYRHFFNPHSILNIFPYNDGSLQEKN